MGENRRIVESLLDYVLLNTSKQPDEYYRLVTGVEHGMAPGAVIESSQARRDVRFWTGQLYLMAQSFKGRSFQDVEALVNEFASLPEQKFVHSKDLGTVAGFSDRTAFYRPEKIRREVGIDLLEVENGTTTGRLKNDEALQSSLLKKIRSKIIAISFKRDSAGFGDSDHDTSFLSEVDVPVATNPNATLRGYANDNNWVIFDRNDDPEKILFKIRWRTYLRGYKESIHDLLGVKPPAFMDVDGTLYEGFLLIDVARGLAQRGVFPQEAATEIEKALTNEDKEYAQRGLDALLKYEEHKKRTSLSGDAFFSKVVECVQEARGKLFPHTNALIPMLSRYFQPILLSAEPLEICLALCELEPFQETLVMPTFVVETELNETPVRKTKETIAIEEQIKKQNEGQYQKALALIARIVEDVQTTPPDRLAEKLDDDSIKD